jgi:hypothetical protein
MTNAPSDPTKGPKPVAGKGKDSERQAIDYGALSVEALNRHTSSPEFTARYRKWLEDGEAAGIQLTPVAKADLEAMRAEDAKQKK